MFKNYLKVAFRKLLRHKGYSAINIVCLAAGIAACLLLFLWVQDELSYDRYHENADRIYRVILQEEVNGRVERLAYTSIPLAPALLNEFPWIRKAIRFGKRRYTIGYRGKLFKETVFTVNPGVQDVFTFPLVQGDPKTAFNSQGTILISEKMKEKYFGEEDPLGKTVTLAEEYDFKVTGVFKNIPRNSHFRFDFLLPQLRYRADYVDNWGVANYHTYILTADNSADSLKTFYEKLPQVVEKYRGKGTADMYKITYILQPLTDIRLASPLKGDFEPGEEIETVYIFSVIALFLLLIACLNYINLATARFVTRARESGLRRVLGATRSQLIRQSLGESFLTALAALPVAILTAELFLPLFNSLSGKTLTFDYFNNFFLLAVLVGIILIVGLLSGIVPVLFITNFRPTDALKGVVKASPAISVMRRILVVFQFSMSIIFIVCTLVASGQLRYIKTKDQGLNKEHVIDVHLGLDREALLKYDILKYEFSKHPDVKTVSASGFMPGRHDGNNNYWIDGMSEKEYLSIGCIPVDYDFIDAFEITLIEGRGFSKDFSTDAESAFIINEAAREEFGWQSAVGKNFQLSIDWKSGKIIGVVKDFHCDSLHREVKPVVLYIDPENYKYISVRIAPNNIQRTIDFLKRIWEKSVHDQPFVYSFLDEDFERLHKSETRMLKILLAVTILELFIACLGLLGLAAFTTEQRTREIGIRKVLGASAPGIVGLLSKDFARWVLVSNVIAWPIAWYAMHRWLQNFALRIDISPWPFLSAGLLAFAVALLTVGYNALRAAAADPVKTLKHE